MIRTQVYLPDDLYRDLKLLANTSGKKFSELVREGAEIVVEKKAIKKKKFGEGFIGVGRKGPKDLSSKLDDYLYIEPYEDKKKNK